MKQNALPGREPSDVDQLYRQGGAALLLSLLVALIYVAAIWPTAPRKLLLTWVLGSGLLLAVRYYFVNRYLRLTPPLAEQRKWLYGFAILATLSGLAWGLVALLFFFDSEPLSQMVTLVILMGLATGALSTMASSPWCYRFYIAAIALPLLYRLVTIGGRAHAALAILTCAFAAVLLVVSRRVHSSLCEIRKVRQADRYRAEVMEMITRSAPLPQILTTIVHGVEARGMGLLCSILMLDSARQCVVIGAAPNIPDFFSQAIQGIPIGPAAGSCGTAMHTGQRVVAEDVRTHPFWVDYRELAVKAGLLSCWSEPIKSVEGNMLGAFAVYRAQPSVPSEEEILHVELAAYLAGIAIERRKLHEDHEIAALVYQNSSEAMVVTDAANRAIAINTAFSQITGYRSKDILDRELTFSSRHARDIADYQQMMDAVLATGKWQGELWNYRKNGERFACRIAINSIFDAEGGIHRRVILLSDITEQKRSDEMIWRQANYDPLIGLPNRRLFRDRLEQEIKKSHRTGSRMGLLFLDLDRFKEVNDSLGHDAGDRLLVEAAKRIAACVRESDTVARLGGDEFTIILSEIDEGSTIERIADEIIAKMADAFHLGSDVVHVSVSIGITVYPDDSTEVEELFRNADLAMYAAKNAGRNRFSYFTSATQKEAQNRVQIVNDLHKALEGGEFELHYQPIVDLASLQIHKAEALLRWRHPIRGLVNPAQFIPLAEETGLIHQIGDWAFREAARAARLFSERSGNDFQISVNVSPVQCHAMKDCGEWLAFLDGLGLKGKNVTIEITEGLLLGADPHIFRLLSQFRDAGINIAIDDFGTGYSSLSYLKRFHIDVLKIDQSFVRDLATDPSDRALAETIIVMGHKLGIQVVAEGIETAEQCRILTDAGCDYGQGYLFSRTSPADVLLSSANLSWATALHADSC